ncbi:hypothetical protein [Novosphingobium sp. TH158]|uniref:hypothetical protein n=1 Tax=Novosphingobium sp. TH158 TaxID=2067455 RepID=UPI000CACD7CD|nr:hypothetical protein [Novosphingobium sp. TH158]PLK26588.1 hypothetical protein C0V78_06550 [Novosphingobium sp. TH158]
MIEAREHPLPGPAAALSMLCTVVSGTLLLIYSLSAIAVAGIGGSLADAAFMIGLFAVLPITGVALATRAAHRAFRSADATGARRAQWAQIACCLAMLVPLVFAAVSA